MDSWGLKKVYVNKIDSWGKTMDTEGLTIPDNNRIATIAIRSSTQLCSSRRYNQDRNRSREV